MSAVAAIAVTASLAMFAHNRPAFMKSTAASAAAAVATRSLIVRFFALHAGCLAPCSASSTARTVKVQAFETECAAAAAAATCCSTNNQ